MHQNCEYPMSWLSNMYNIQVCDLSSTITYIKALKDNYAAYSVCKGNDEPKFLATLMV